MRPSQKRRAFVADRPEVNSSESSTYKVVVTDGFEIEYQDGTSASGDYFTDDFAIGGITVSNLQMGIADKTAVGTGILGIGFELNEAAETMYSNLVADMVNQSKISTMAYSLYLNDYYSSTGNILFGGVDTDKFIGELVTVPILPDAESGNYSSFTVGVTELSFAFSNGTTYNQSLSSQSGSLSSILDSGTTLSYLPDDIATTLFDAVGAYQYTSLGSSLALVDCGLNVEFNFQINNNVTITVPSDELVIDAFEGTTLPSDVPFASTCLFGIQNIGSSSGASGSSARTADYAILGDSFLRSAYVVYDLGNLQIGLAPANLNSTSTNVQELKAGESSLPAFSGVASQTASSSSSSGTSTTSSSATGTSSGGSTSSGTLLSSTSISHIPTTSVDAFVSIPSEYTSISRTSSASVIVSSVTVIAYSTASAASIPSSWLSGFGSITANTITFSSTAASLVSSTVLVSVTNIHTATSSGKSAAMVQGPPDLRGLFGVVGITLAFVMSGSLLFWL